MKAPRDHIVTLKAKLSIPHLADTIRRDRFIPLFHEIEKKRILTVVAGAGYGKTTLVAQMCKQLACDTIWYRLDRSDQDLITFIHYLVAGICQYYPDFGEETFDRIATAKGIKKERSSILAVFLNEMEKRIVRPMVLVLDDYHLAQPSEEIRRVMRFFIEHPCPRVHLVIISRSVPQLHLSRLIAGREAFDIGEADLAFDVGEIANLYEDIFDIHLNKNQQELLYDRTDGWVAGLIMFNYMLRGKAAVEITAQLNQLYGDSGLLSSYLDENIFTFLPAQTADFLLKTSILSRLEIEACNALLSIDNAGAILMELEKKHLFTFPLSENKEVYYYHQLFQDFLQNKLKRERGKKAFLALHGKAARIREKAGDTEGAIDHYLAGEFYSEACALLNRIGRDLINGGRLNLFLSYYHQIPPDVVESDPWLLYLFGRALELSGRTQEAIGAFDASHAKFETAGIQKGVGLSLNRLATNYYVIGDFKRAEATFKLLLGSIREMPRLYVDALGHLIFILSQMGNSDQADHYYSEAMKALPGPGETDLHAWIFLNHGFRYFTAGDLRKAKSLGQRANGIAKRLDLHHLLTMGYHLVSLCDLLMGNFEKALDGALKGIVIGQEKGFIETAHAWNWSDACLSAAALGRLDDAIAYGQKNLSICRDLGSLWSEAWAQRGLTVAYLKNGEVAKAEAAARQALDLLDPLSLPFDKAVMQLGLAAVLIDKGELEEAHPLLEAAEQTLEHYNVQLAGALLLHARYHHVKGNRPAALAKLQDAIALGKKYRHDRWLVGERKWIIPLLIRLYHERPPRNFVEDQFLNFGARSYIELGRLYESEKGEMKMAASELLRSLKQRPPFDLHIACFGSFELTRGNMEIPPDQWPGEKPKLLFKYLALNHGRGFIARDELLELFWPDEAPDTTSKRLHVALTKLRRTLEPELTRGMPSAYLLREGEAYRLYPGAAGTIDVALFDMEIAAAQKTTEEALALAHYLKAEAWYKGHLFEEDHYIDWCREARENYRLKYLTLLEAIISGYRKQENWAKCIKYGQRYVTADPYAEEAYQALMIFHHAMGNLSMITKTYELCRGKLEKDLDCLISDETTDLYKQLVLPRQNIHLT